MLKRIMLALMLTVGAVTTHGAVPAAVALSVPGRTNANVSMAAAGDFVAIVWSASTAAGVTDIYAAASRDAGATFSAPVRVNGTTGDARVNGEQPPRVALVPRGAQPPRIAVVWTAKGAAGTRLLTAQSLDGAQTFGASTVVNGSDAPGNRGWEALTASASGQLFTAWLDHRRMSEGESSATSSTHHHHEASATPTPAPPAAATDGVAMAQLSQLFVTALDGAPRSVTNGVCYCCKTALAFGPTGALYAAWRHVYPGNIRDIAFAVSRDNGGTFGAPVRVSEDKWQLDGCPDDGPSMAVDAAGGIHVVWPTLVMENGKPVKALFHARSKDGRTFSSRSRLPVEGQANHPQMAIASDGTLAVVWDESGNGSRRIASARGVSDASGQIRFTRSREAWGIGSYPVVACTTSSVIYAWTESGAGRSAIRVARR